jgi:hypothetical protein
MFVAFSLMSVTIEILELAFEIGYGERSYIYIHILYGILLIS